MRLAHAFVNKNEISLLLMETGQIHKVLRQRVLMGMVTIYTRKLKSKA
jgi:hypothetical protein